MSSEGTKVTTDPATQRNPKIENPGIVTSDSLAADSIQSGGSFAANSASRGPMAQPSHSTTTATTDTSNATELSAAESRAERGGQPPEYDLPAGGRGPTYAKGSGSGSNVTSYGNAAPAPTYASTTATSGELRPKGKNISEGGFDSDAPNASFNSEIGGKNDPGRVALNAFEKRNQPVSGGAGARGQKVGEGTAFDALGDGADA